jgi:protein-S-isoprenylcysteine O-methyltransferase Ste14
MRMSKCRVRLILWLILAGISIVGGIITDLILKTRSFSLFLRFLGLVGMLLAHFPLKRTGRLLKLRGESEEWGCTNRLVITDIYQCLRHPHHMGVGIFMTSLGLLIGHLWSFLFITVTQWAWVIAFLFLVEERELVEKFGEQYGAYRKRVPMLFANPVCVFRVLSKPIDNSPPGDGCGSFFQ